MTQAGLTGSGLTVSLGKREVLGAQGAIDVTIALKKLTIFVGPNGAGKSTLLKVLAGILDPTGGTVTLDGVPLSLIPAVDRARHLAWSPPGAHVPFAYSALEVVLLGRFPWHRGAPTRKDAEAATAALARVGAVGLAGRPVTALSSGERQRVLLARVLAGEAPYLLFDEPCANLDIAASLRFLDLSRRLADEGRGVALVIHDLALAHRYADQIVCLDRGSVAAVGAPDTALSPAVVERIFGVQTSQSGIQFSLP